MFSDYKVKIKDNWGDKFIIPVQAKDRIDAKTKAIKWAKQHLQYEYIDIVDIIKIDRRKQLLRFL